MIIIGFGCGLGNQMFQYAFYLSMIEKYPQMEFKADTQNAFPEEHNGFELDKVFGIYLQECTSKERKKLSEIPINKSFINKGILKARNKFGIHKKSYYKQADYTEFYPEVYDFSQETNKYMLGIWGNEKYFRNIKMKLQKEIFVFNEDRLNDESRKIKRIIESANDSVSIHVRKGDFVNYQNHIMKKEYYENAIELIEKEVGETNYFVFSDDMEYAKEVIPQRHNILYIMGNDKSNSWMDMYLMSLCKNNIIANSSFSFWGAYLNKNIGKVVIAPNVPFINCKNAFICEDWITINDGFI